MGGGCGPYHGGVTERLGKYEILGIVGTSVAGAVYLANDPDVDRTVAVKQLVPSLAREPGFMTGFREEAEIMARLEHPNCVHVYDYFEDETGAYIVSEHVGGASLRSLLDDSGRLEPQQALGVTRGALAGLAFAHELGLVHRDVKPENLLADREGTAKLADFGQAFFTGEVKGGERQSTGAPAYMSPEQVRGDQGDVRSDVYATGVVLYEFLAGRPPFIARSRIAVMKMHLEREPPDLNRVNPRVPVDISQMLSTALSKNPSDRYSSAGEFLAVLEEVARDTYGGPWLADASIAGLVATAAAGRVVTGAEETVVDFDPPPPRQPGPEPGMQLEMEPALAAAPRRAAGLGVGVAAAVAGLLVGVAIGSVNRAGGASTGVLLTSAMVVGGLLLTIVGLLLLRPPGAWRLIARRGLGVLLSCGGAVLLGYGGIGVIRILQGG